MTLEDTIDAVVARRVREELSAFERRIVELVKPRPQSEFLSIRKAAVVAGVHPETIRRWIQRGILPEHRPSGGNPRLRRDELERAIGGKPERSSTERTPEEAAAAILKGAER